MAAKKVLIIGAGYAGIEAALTLSKKKKRNDIEITVVDKNDYHTLLTELHEVAGNRIPEEGIRIPLGRVFQYSRVKHLTDEIKDFDFANNTVRSADRSYSYDYLVLALGSKPNFFCIDGLEEHAFTLWSYDDALKIREHVKDCFLKASQEPDLEKRKQLLTFVVGGAGATGVEMVGELAHWTRSLRKQYGLPKDSVKLIIIDALPKVLCAMKQKNSDKAKAYMEKKLGVEVILSAPVDKLTADGVTAGGKYISTKTVIWCAGVCAVDEVDYMEYDKRGGAKRIEVRKTCQTANDNVYCVGDMCGLGDEDGKPYAAMVENAIQTGHGAALNILRDIRGQELKEVKVTFHGTMVSIGNYYCVSEIMDRVLPNWMSILMKYFVNVHYLWEINGFAGVARYLYHETLERRQRKLFLEKHWSTRTQAWWGFPLRMFLGGVWIYEGIQKINEGWFTEPKLKSFMGSMLDFSKLADQFKTFFEVNLGFLKFGVYSAKIAAAADAVSSASGASGSVEPGASYTLGEAFFKVDFPLVSGIVKSLSLGSTGGQLFFQTFIVCAEILVGLLLIAGLFTFLAAFASLFLNVNFIMTTGIYYKTWWFLFASIALMAGAGRAFGLDYYAIPYLNNLWERTWKKRNLRFFFKGALDRHERDN